MEVRELFEVVSHIIVEERKDMELCEFGGQEVREDEQRVMKSRVRGEEGLKRDENDFFQLDQMGTLVEPKCGGCKCGRCPVPGSVYSYREQMQLDLINWLRRYNDEKGFLETEYPWKRGREEFIMGPFLFH